MGALGADAMSAQYAIFEVTPRRFTAALTKDAPVHWACGDAFLSHMLNTYTLLIPGNEAYYIRTLKRFLPRLDEPALKRAVAGFMAQESNHGVGHQRHRFVLEEQGYHVERFQRWTDWLLYKVVEPLTPPVVRLSIVAFVEHINAYIGHEFLAQRILDGAEPRLRALFEWHFAEEIEHKHVAFEALRRVSPSYVVRLLGPLLAVPLFYLLMSLGTLNLVRQDGSLWQRRTWRSLFAHLGSRHHMARRSLAHILAYLKPGFHPWQLQDANLAEEVVGASSRRRGDAWEVTSLARPGDAPAPATPPAMPEIVVR
jgi:predicted metal-dependent hydrolase